MTKLKTVSYVDENGALRKSLLPQSAPDDDAPLGIPVGFNLREIYPDPFASELEEALAGRGIVSIEDLDRPGIKTIIREEIQRILRYEVHALIKFLRTTK